MVIDNLVDTILSRLKELSRTETVVGEPVTLEHVTIIPVSKLSVGFGAGGGTGSDDKGKGEASGGGASIEPVAFFVIREEKVELVTIKKDGSNLSKFMELVPRIMDSVPGLNKEKSSEKKEKKKNKKKGSDD